MNNTWTRKKNFDESLIIIVILLLPVLSMYKAFQSFSMADVAIILITFYLVQKNKLSINFNYYMKPLLFLCLWLFISWFTDAFLLEFVYSIIQNALVNSFFSAVRVIFYFVFSAIITIEIRNWKYFYKTYRFFVILFSIITILQFVIHILTGKVILGYFSFLQMMNSNIDSERLINLNTYSTYRPYSVFTEPGMFARYVTPYICFIFFGRERYYDYLHENNKTREIVIVIVAALLSRSGQAIAMIFIIFFIWIMRLFVTGRIKKRYFFLFFPIVIGFLYYVNTDSYRLTVLRLLPSLAGTSSNSFGTRIYRGFLVYNQLPILMKIFGVGYGNLDLVTKVLNIVTRYDTLRTSGYMNGAAYILANTGLIGLVFLLSAYIQPLITSKNMYVKVFSLICLFLSFVGATSVAIMGVMYHVFLFGFGLIGLNSDIKDFGRDI